MKTIDEIRRDNLAKIAEEFGGPSALADALGKSASQVSQWMNGSANSGTGKARGMRSSSCREIETLAGKPTGWMEVDHGATAKSEAGIPQAATAPQYAWVDNEEMELITLFRTTDEQDRKEIMSSARLSRRVIKAPRIVKN